MVAMINQGIRMLIRRSFSTLLALIFVLGLNQVFVRSAEAAYQVIATVPVGSAPGAANGVGVNPLTNRIYVSNNGNNTVSVIDGLANAVTATIPVGSGPAGVGVNPSTNRVYVADNGVGIGPGSVSVIDATTNTVIATIPVDQIRLPSRSIR
jgi:YVTN family beta-propeller protein